MYILLLGNYCQNFLQISYIPYWMGSHWRHFTKITSKYFIDNRYVLNIKQINYSAQSTYAWGITIIFKIMTLKYRNCMNCIGAFKNYRKMAASNTEVLGWKLSFKRRYFYSDHHGKAMGRVSQFGYTCTPPVPWVADVQWATCNFILYLFVSPWILCVNLTADIWPFRRNKCYIWKEWR